MLLLGNHRLPCDDRITFSMSKKPDFYFSFALISLHLVAFWALREDSWWLRGLTLRKSKMFLLFATKERLSGAIRLRSAGKAACEDHRAHALWIPPLRAEPRPARCLRISLSWNACGIQIGSFQSSAPAN